MQLWVLRASSRLLPSAADIIAAEIGTVLVMDDDDDPPVDWLKFSALIAAWELADAALTYPCDVARTQQMVSGKTNLPLYQHLSGLVREGSWRSLYRGFAWGAFGGLPAEIWYYVAYTGVKRNLLASRLGDYSPSACYGIAAVTADGTSQVLHVPSDVISQRMRLRSTFTVSVIKPAAGPSNKVRGEIVAVPLNRRPKSGGEIVRSILRQQGVFGLWRGLVVSTSYTVPYAGVWWISYEVCKNTLARRFDYKEGEENSAMVGGSGAVAALLAGVTTNPLDVVKTRFQCVAEPTPLPTILNHLRAQNGVRGFWAGMGARLWAAVPRSVATVLVYETVVSWSYLPHVSMAA